jgi:DNA-binding NarL/FixJ family response regulator
MHSNCDDEEKIVRSIKAGAVGHISKNTSAPALFKDIVIANRGGITNPPESDERSAASSNAAAIAFSKIFKNMIRGWLGVMFKAT